MLFRSMGALSLATQRRYRNKQRVLMTEWEDLRRAIPTIRQMATMQQQQPSVPFAFPYASEPLAVQDEPASSSMYRLHHARPKSKTHGLRPKAATRKRTETEGEGAPENEKTIIGSSAPLLWNDLNNDTFLIKQKTAEPVV